MTFKQIEDKGSIFLDLSSKFAGNLQLAVASMEPLCTKAELGARTIHSLSLLLANGLKPSPSQTQILCIYDEVFADIVCSMYLAGSGLDKPAQMLLRRAFELGLANVYLWDLPHLFWAWKDHDRDLNFGEIVEHLSSDGYRTFVQSENPLYIGDAMLDVVVAKSIYRNLSNIVHGKITQFESLLPDRFQYNETDWKADLSKVLGVEDILIGVCRRRFECVERSFHTGQAQVGD